ncbi:MAG: shikimate dehydrogenase, partial [Tenericutes bacterium HGW-Tenericutes-3]
MSAKFGLIGHNISYSKSPKIHLFMAKKLGIDMTYELLDVDADQIPSLIKDLKEGLFKGFNVTIPYKETVIPYIDILTSRAKKIGAVNTIYLKDGAIIGDNTDYDGFLGCLNINEIDPKGKQVYILGTGGAAKAVYAVLKDLGAHITVVSRNKKHADLFFGEVIEYKDIKPSKVDIYIQTTPVGTFPDVNASVLTKNEVEGKTVVDLVYNPLVTQIMKHSQKGVSGIYMLIIQAL